MLSKERLIAIYQEWPDEKLQTEYARSDEYEDMAIEAMKTVMISRGLSVERNEELLQYSVAVEDLPHYHEETDEEFAEQQKRADGVYYENIMLSGGKSELFGCTLALAIIGAVTMGVFIFAEAVDPWINWLIFGSIILFLILSRNILKNNKVPVKLYQSGRSLKLEIQSKKETFELTGPFSYECYGEIVETNYKGIRTRRPNLYIRFEHPDGRVILFHEDKSALNTMPPGWPDIRTNPDFHKWDKRFTQHGTNAMELEKLRRILDGLS